MIKNGKQFLNHNGKSYQCEFAGYVNPIQHQWLFIIDGIDNNIHTPDNIEFLNTKMSICSTVRKAGKTNITAWIL